MPEMPDARCQIPDARCQMPDGRTHASCLTYRQIDSPRILASFSR
jgi:hypothetical protein